MVLDVHSTTIHILPPRLTAMQQEAQNGWMRCKHRAALSVYTTGLFGYGTKSSLAHGFKSPAIASAISDYSCLKEI